MYDDLIKKEKKEDGFNEGDLIKVRAYLDYCLFPRPPIVLGTNDNTFGITRWNIMECIEGCSNIEESSLVFTGEFVEPVKSGSPYTIVGKCINHPKYGLQYQIIYLNEEVDLTKLKNQKAFLSTFLTQLQIQEMYKVYDNPMEVIANHDVEGLKKVHGIGDYIANCIINRFEDNKDNSRIYIDLEKYGFTPTFIQKLTKRYKSPSIIINKVKNEPYSLCYEMDGVGFKTCDNIALKGGLNPRSAERIEAYVKHFLEEQAEDGNSYVTASEVLLSIYDYFGGKDEITETIDRPDGTTISNIGLALQDLQANDIITIEDNENKSRRRIYLNSVYALENSIANHLQRLLKAENHFNYIGWEERIKTLEKEQGFEFDETQMEGIKMGLRQQVCMIAGGAGCGKSSLVSGILAGIGANEGRYSFAQTALSGRAAAKLKEVTGSDGCTIHRLLRYNPVHGFEHNEDNPLPYDIIILDEISLVGGSIFNDLVKAIASGSKLIMLGDPNQLEAIGMLNLADDFLKSNKIPTVVLTKIHRQAAKSGIITSSQDVRNQVQLFDNTFKGTDIRGELQDMILDVSFNKEEISMSAIGWFNKYYESDLVNKDIMKIHMLSPVRERGECCVRELNRKVQSLVNPHTEYDVHIQYGEKENPSFIFENDKVMCIKNNYSVLTEDERMTAIFNGWVGIVQKIDPDGVWVQFIEEPSPVFITRGDAGTYLTLGYASTVHKYQGSDCPVIIGIVDYSTPPKMLTRQLLYTLITRAKKRCVLVGQSGALIKSIATDFVSTKRTFMKELLEK